MTPRVASLLINYADRGFAEAQKLNTHTGVLVGGLDRAVPYRREHLDAGFCERNRDVLEQPQGAGCWLWKPYVVVRALKEEMNDGDILFYADSGCFFVAAVAPVLEMCLQRPDKPILLFTGDPANANRRYAKRDCFHYMGLDREPFLSAPQSIASFFVCRKTDFTVSFFEEWLHLAEDPRLLTDQPNQCGLPNYPDFAGHRYDQSILSLLGAKHGVSTCPDISQWGNGFRPSSIPQIIAQARWSA